MQQTKKRQIGWREARRLRAWELRQDGWLQQEIADALGASQSTVSEWLKRAREGGVEALQDAPRPGRPRRLSREQLAELPSKLVHGAEAYGFRGDVWTLDRVKKVIEKEFGVKYHRDHVCKLLQEVGWSCQKPKRRATQQNEFAVHV